MQLSMPFLQNLAIHGEILQPGDITTDLARSIYYLALPLANVVIEHTTGVAVHVGYRYYVKRIRKQGEKNNRQKDDTMILHLVISSW
jgi:hypothetical protein